MTLQEKYNEKINHFKEMIIDMIDHTFKNEGYIAPVVFALIEKEGETGIAILGDLNEFMKNDSSKDNITKMIKQLNKELKPIATALVTEAWMSVYSGKKSPLDKDGNYKEGIVKPSEDPNKIEIVMITFETFKTFSSELKNVAGC